MTLDQWHEYLELLDKKKCLKKRLFLSNGDKKLLRQMTERTVFLENEPYPYA